MLKWLTNRTRLRHSAQQIYGSIVTQARRPGFYTAAGVPDTLEGRFELIVVHMTLVLARLESEGNGTAALRRTLVEAFVDDMDDAMRALGVGDIVVGRKVRTLSEALQGRYRTYATALASGDSEALTDGLVRNLFAGAADRAAGTVLLTRYMQRTAADLDALSLRDLAAGALEFPPPPVSTSPPARPHENEANR